jgi:hypothetical protein
MRRAMAMAVICGAILLAGVAASTTPKADPRMKGALRHPAVSGWTTVHLQGTPAEIGYQHGYLLADEIEDLEKVFKLELAHDTGKDWNFFRDASKNVLWPHIEQEYREEMQGIVEGLNARDVKLDVWDVVAMNAAEEWSYYVAVDDKAHSIASLPTVTAPEHCSAFVAVGSYTRDGKVVIAHNAWTEYKEGSRWNIIFDIAPSEGYRILMDGMPGLIHSGDDYGVNSAGLAITETTIGQFVGFDPKGIPEFVRARKAMQYSANIDDFARIMQDGNNGGYANTWLLADTRNNEIGQLELGLKHVTLKRTKDGYFVGSNFPENPELIRDEASAFPVADLSISANARHVRWEQLMHEYKGKIDVAAAQQFLADHYDTFSHQTAPSERTLCGHIDLSARGSNPWQPPFGPAGAVQNKAADGAMLAQMSFTAAMGHADGIDFKAAQHLKEHPEFAWEKGVLRDLDSHPWTTFRVAR